MLTVLRSADENVEARRELERRGLSMIRTDWLGRLGRLMGIGAMSVGDRRKSWDVLKTAEFLESRLPKDAAIVDFGAFHSETTGTLSRMGFTNLHGVDLNPSVLSGPYRDRIRYVVGDFHATTFPPSSFAAITAISAIEHGQGIDSMLSEVARLLAPGGYFVASTDYWPEKTDTGGITIFGMDWTIFSARELGAMFDAARARGLVPVGALDYGAGSPVIEFAGRHYTFAWFALQKQHDAA
jgi:SAM-dependent methyltransferase